MRAHTISWNTSATATNGDNRLWGTNNDLADRLRVATQPSYKRRYAGGGKVALGICKEIRCVDNINAQVVI